MLLPDLFHQYETKRVLTLRSQMEPAALIYELLRGLASLCVSECVDGDTESKPWSSLSSTDFSLGPSVLLLHLRNNQTGTPPQMCSLVSCFSPAQEIWPLSKQLFFPLGCLP